MRGSLPTCFNNALTAPCKVKVAGEKSYACREREREREREKVVYLPNFPNIQAIILICHMHNVSQTREDRFVNLKSFIGIFSTENKKFLKFNIYQVNMCSKYMSFSHVL
jgi:hypothetical protein